MGWALVEREVALDPVDAQPWLPLTRWERLHAPCSGMYVEGASLSMLQPCPCATSPVCSSGLMYLMGGGTGQYSSLGSSAGIRGNQCGELPWLEVGPEVLPQRRSRDAAYRPKVIFQLVQVGPAGSHGPGLVQLALWEVLDTALREETSSWLLGRFGGKDEEVTPAAWEPRALGKSFQGSTKEAGLTPLFLNKISTERKGEPSPARACVLCSKAVFLGFPNQA